MGNCDPYSDSPEPLVVKQLKFTGVEGSQHCYEIISSYRTWLVRIRGLPGVGNERTGVLTVTQEPKQAMPRYGG
jgi:hypothetical protein